LENLWSYPFGKGEQDFVEKSKINIKLLPGEWLGIYTVGCARPEKVITLKQIEDKYFHEYGLPLLENKKFGSDIKLVHFLYDDNMIEDREKWIQDLWNTT
jgi:hypothetical protein